MAKKLARKHGEEDSAGEEDASKPRRQRDAAKRGEGAASTSTSSAGKTDGNGR